MNILQLPNNSKASRAIQGVKGGIVLPPVKSQSFKANVQDKQIMQKKNPFHQRRGTTTEEDLKQKLNDMQSSQKEKPLVINRQGTDFDTDSREVELKAQSAENSQLFVENSTISQSFNQSTLGNIPNAQENKPIQQDQKKITVNLEDAVLQEQKLYQILESLRNNLNASLYCDDWWDVTETGNITITIATQVIKDSHLKQAIMKSQKYETMAIGIIQFYHLMAYETSTSDSKININTFLKNLMFYIHQNFLVVTQIMLSRMVRKKTNFWASNLYKMIEQKQLKKVSNKDQCVQLLRVNMANAENIFRNLIKQNNKKKLFSNINDWLNAIQVTPNEKIRENLYNIEQYRFDALNITQELKSKLSQSTGNQVKGISQSTKTSGSSNLVGGQGNSITGKNPFAILKASAIASPSSAVFPNNFTNLPKVMPPFLPPLEGDQNNSTYTLVLDLDETLIHNVDYGADSYFLVRPGCVYFIELMSKFYEIVIFTAALQEYADQVIDQIDVNSNIKYRLYRQHTSQNGPFLVKDLSLLGRDLSKVIIIDNISDNFIIQPDNGIFISTWHDDMSDNFLEEISPLLIEMVEKKVPDVRKALRSYRDQILRQISNGMKEPQIKFE